jgi:hypothetical protein
MFSYCSCLPGNPEQGQGATYRRVPSLALRPLSGEVLPAWPELRWHLDYADLCGYSKSVATH